MQCSNCGDGEDSTDLREVIVERDGFPPVGAMMCGDCAEEFQTA